MRIDESLAALTSRRSQLRQCALRDLQEGFHHGRVALLGVPGEEDRPLQGHACHRDPHEALCPELGPKSMDRHEGESDAGADQCLAGSSATQNKAHGNE